MDNQTLYQSDRREKQKKLRN